MTDQLEFESVKKPNSQKSDQEKFNEYIQDLSNRMSELGNLEVTQIGINGLLGAMIYLCQELRNSKVISDEVDLQIQKDLYMTLAVITKLRERIQLDQIIGKPDNENF